MSNITAFPGPSQPAPTIENGTKPPNRQANDELRGSRAHLTPIEIDQLILVARQNREGLRDATMILMAYRHGLRVGELVALRWDQVHLAEGLLDVRRLKDGIDSTHPLGAPELRALRRLKRSYPASPYVFLTRAGAPVSDAAFRKMFARLGVKARMPWPINPHMLRHACGYKLANDGVDTRSLQIYLGHRSILNTERYTQVSPARFKGFWDD